MSPVEDEPHPSGPEDVVRGSRMGGAVEFHLTEPFKVVHNCHCSRCRRARAAAHATNGLAAMDAVRFVRGEDHLKSYRLHEARFFTQVFCDPSRTWSASRPDSWQTTAALSRSTPTARRCVSRWPASYP